ncbi:hypothetical protein RJ639_002490 [Escallonia herrerae]|uniref:Uncharacterized protein n=1 Tax=Escallonia herrerae TaxID=1293975 RepID=A0AA89BNK2_9ASTE|nr:hypothetical protein RJ639_002490 [Escallonia herrerae]
MSSAVALMWWWSTKQRVVSPATEQWWQEERGQAMTISKRLADRKVERFEKNIKKRGAVPETTTKKGNNPYGNKWRHGLSRRHKGSLTPLTCGDNGLISI